MSLPRAIAYSPPWVKKVNRRGLFADLEYEELLLAVNSLLPFFMVKEASNAQDTGYFW
jgi:hypothetical protein